MSLSTYEREMLSQVSSVSINFLSVVTEKNISVSQYCNVTVNALHLV